MYNFLIFVIIKYFLTNKGNGEIEIKQEKKFP